MRLTWPAIYLLLFAYRAAFSVIAVSVLAHFTTLGDSQGYAFGGLNDVMGQQISTYTTRAIGSAFNTMFFASHHLIFIAFQSIGFLGIVLLLESLPTDLRTRILPLFLLPSFTVWTSVAGKETIIVFLVCLIHKAAVEIAKAERPSLVQLAIAIGGLAMYKPHFLASALFLLGMCVLASFTRQRSAIILGALIATIVILFAFRPVLEAIAPDLFIRHFTGDEARSTREKFWTEPGDFFGKAGLGMWLAFVGPTLAEARISVVHLFSFIESLVLVGFLVFLMLRNLPRIPLFCFLLALGTVFWTIAPSYGTGVMNPGTAIRYRAGWLPFIFFSFAVLMAPSFGHAWVENVRRKWGRIRAPSPTELNSVRPA